MSPLRRSRRKYTQDLPERWSNHFMMKYHGLCNLEKEILRFLAAVDSVDDQPGFFSPILIKHNLEVHGVRERSYTAYSHLLVELEQGGIVIRRKGSGANNCISEHGRELIAD